MLISIQAYILSKEKIDEYKSTEWHHSRHQKEQTYHYLSLLREVVTRQSPQKKLASELIIVLKEIDAENNYSLVDRKRIIPLADSLHIDYGNFDSNYSLINKLISTLHINTPRKRDFKILVCGVNHTSADSSEIDLVLAEDFKFIGSDMYFFNKQNEIFARDLVNYTGELKDLTVQIVNPFTCEIAHFKNSAAQ